MKKERLCRLRQTFFGLTPEYKVELHKQIFTLCYHSNGGFDFMSVYSMPVHLRLFYFKQLIDVKNDENKRVSDSKESIPNTKKPSSPPRLKK